MPLSQARVAAPSVIVFVGGVASEKVKSTAASSASVIESVVSVAVYVTVSTAVSEAENVTTPDAFVLPPPVIVEPPAPWASVSRSCPRRRLPPTSRSVTVIVAVSVPLAYTLRRRRNDGRVRRGRR